MPTCRCRKSGLSVDHAYLATVADKVFVYDIADPANPKLLDTLKVDARLINDISTTPDEKIGVFTRRGKAPNRKNGIVFLDTSDASHLKVLSEYTATVSGGVHSTPTLMAITSTSPTMLPGLCASLTFRIRNIPRKWHAGKRRIRPSSLSAPSTDR